MNFRLGRLLGFFSSFVILRFAMDDVRKRTNETAAVAARAVSQQSEIFFRFCTLGSANADTFLRLNENYFFRHGPKL